MIRLLKFLFVKRSLYFLLSNQDVAPKNYLGKNTITIAGGVVSGDIKLNIDSDLVRSLWCNNLTAGQKFKLLLGTDINMLSYPLPDSQLPTPKDKN